MYKKGIGGGIEELLWRFLRDFNKKFNTWATTGDATLTYGGFSEFWNNTLTN